MVGFSESRKYVHTKNIYKRYSISVNNKLIIIPSVSVEPGDWLKFKRECSFFFINYIIFVGGQGRRTEMNSVRGY